MKRNNKTPALRLAAAIVLCGAALAGSAPEARAQSATSTAPQTQKVIRTRFVVQVMTYQSIIVHSPDDFRTMHTFAFSPGIRDQMQKLFTAGGYQYGDTVSVWYRPGTEVALKIKGKPSKSK